MTAWTRAQVTRLEAEWRQLRRAFAYHAYVEVIALSGDPPNEFQLNYKVTTLAVDDAGQLVYVATCPVHLWLPPQFPHNAPVVRPMSAVFHPNVAMDWVHLNPPWKPDRSLVDVVTQVGFLLAFRSYDPGAVANPVAMTWADTNPHLLPTDPAANFSPAAGGEPLARIARFGGVTLRTLQERAESAAERLVLGALSPTSEELQDLGRDVDVMVPSFLDPDIPDHLRGPAAELRDLVVSILSPDSVWYHIGRQIELSHAVAAAAKRVADAEESVRRVLASEAAPLDRRGGKPSGTAAKPAAPAFAGAAARVPAPAAIQAAAVSLRRAVREAEDAVAHLRSALAPVAAAVRLPAASAQPNSLLARRLSRELARLAAASEPARAAGASLASLESVLHRASLEAAAAERVAAWAEHGELLRRGHDLTERLKSSDPADLQAYFVESPAGRAGPYEFEETIEVAGAQLAVWNLRASVVRVVDAKTEEVIARGDGRVQVPAVGAGPGTSGSSAFSVVVGEHTDELRVQLDYLISNARDALARLQSNEEEPLPGDARSTWPARLAAELDQPHEQQQAHREHRRATEAWKQLAADLSALGRFKQRLATHALLTRLIEFVPRAGADRERLVAIMARADSRLADIGARSVRDSDSERLIIPVQYAAEYARFLGERETAQQQVQRLQLGLDGATERLRLRLSKPRLLGSAELPPLGLLREPAKMLAVRHADLSDGAVQDLVSRLEEMLGTPLRSAPAPAADTATAVEGLDLGTDGWRPDRKADEDI